MLFYDKHTGKTFESEVMVMGDGIELVDSPVPSPVSNDAEAEPVTEKPKRKKAVK